MKNFHMLLCVSSHKITVLYSFLMELYELKLKASGWKTMEEFQV